jgi:hypothetical protein
MKGFFRKFLDFLTKTGKRKPGIYKEWGICGRLHRPGLMCPDCFRMMKEQEKKREGGRNL